MRSHIDLFTGIAGFSIACKWNDIETVVMCEKDERCRQFLERTWPGIPIVRDVRDFDGSKWTGAFILTAGVPCQPTSLAGKRRGKEDDRWLWPEALRIINEARPDWCLLENPIGLIGMGFDGICSTLESQGYEVGAVNIPACAVNSPQIRQRVWIVAHRSGAGLERPDGSKLCKSRPTFIGQGNVADTAGTRQDRPQGEEQYIQRSSLLSSRFGNRHKRIWDEYEWTYCADGKLRRTPDDSFGLVDGLHRSVLAALGNSIVPQVAYQIIKAIKEADDA